MPAVPLQGKQTLRYRSVLPGAEIEGLDRLFLTRAA